MLITNYPAKLTDCMSTETDRSDHHVAKLCSVPMSSPLLEQRMGYLRPALYSRYCIFELQKDLSSGKIMFREIKGIV